MNCSICDTPLSYYLDIAVKQCGPCYFARDVRLPIKRDYSHHPNRRLNIPAKQTIVTTPTADIFLHAAERGDKS
jgi:hypothetical protein